MSILISLLRLCCGIDDGFFALFLKSSEDGLAEDDLADRNDTSTPIEVKTRQIHKLGIFCKRSHLIFSLMSKKTRYFHNLTFFRLLRGGNDNALFMYDFIWILLCI